MSRLDQLTKSLVAVYAEKLSKAEQQTLVECLEVLAYDQKYNKFANFFPDTGQYRRELYPKHVAFFAAGATYTERAFIAGNRVGKCLSYRTVIELADGTTDLAGVLYERGETFEVMSWDGEKAVPAKVVDFVKKKPETIYRVWLENGQWFECAANHRVLCQDGSWRFVGTLLGQLPCLPPTIEGSDRQAQWQDVVRWIETLPSSPGGCREGFRFCGGQPLSDEGIDPDSSLPLSDAQQHSVALSCEGGRGSRYTSIDQLFGGPRSSQDANVHAWDRSLALAGQDFLPGAQSPRCCIQSDQPCPNIYDRLREALEVLQGQYQFSSLLSPSSEVNRVIAYSVIGVNDIYDFTVPPHNNYISHGVVHHNSEAGAFETVCHITGEYPKWWTGLRYDRPILAWAGGDTATTCRDIIQKKLLGEINDFGSGMIPKDLIVDHKPRRGVPDAVESVVVRHSSGGTSRLVIKTYEQGRATWQGSEVDWIWVDEECPQDVYGEALIRLMTTKGSIITTFTPLNGVTELVLSFLENSQDTDAEFPKYVQVVAWDDVPHISEEMKAKMLAATPPQLREARSKGTPTVGEGLVYPVDPKNIIIDDFVVPKHYQRLYGMDVGWSNTAAVWGAWDRDNDIIYIVSEHKQGQAEPIIHAKAIKARGEWIRGQIDPAARGRSQIDGESLFNLYRGEGLLIYPANNAVEAGIFSIWERLSTGRLKIFKSCTGILRELSLYHRNDKGKIVKKNDHLLDALRYLINAEPSMWTYPQAPQRKVIGMKNYMNACT